MDTCKIGLAEKTFLALLNPYGSVERTFPLALRQSVGGDKVRYVGVKNRVQIPERLLRALRHGGFYLHTVDGQSLGGRAVDVRMTNPVTGRPMTGSSSGTAVNVFIGVNDLGIGTDGGGSVLAPAASLNLYALMSPLICPEWLENFPCGMSTDGIRFLSSIGFMARDLQTLRDACVCVPGLLAEGTAPAPATDADAAPEAATDADAPSTSAPAAETPQPAPTLAVQREALDYMGELAAGAHDVVEPPSTASSRTEQLAFLEGALETHDVVVTLEGPIDTQGMGDTVFGHFDEVTAASQAAAGKGLMKVANMARATALVVPVPRLATALLLCCRSEPAAVARMLDLAGALPPFSDGLCERYFRDLAKYVACGFGEVDYRIQG